MKYQCPVVWSVEENTKRKKPKDRKKPVKKNWCFYWSDGKNSRFVKEQEANRLLSRLGLKTISSKIRLFSGILFSRYRINKIVVWDKVPFGKQNFKYFFGYKNVKKIRPWIFIPKMAAYRRDFDKSKCMSFL